MEEKKIIYSSSIKTCLIMMYALTILNFILTLGIYIYNHGFKYIEYFNYRELYYNKFVLILQILLLLRCLTVIYEKYIKDNGINIFFFLIIIAYSPLILSLFYSNNIILYIVTSILFCIIHFYLFYKVITIKMFMFVFLATLMSLIGAYLIFILFIKSLRNIILIFVSCTFLFYLFKGLIGSDDSKKIMDNKKTTLEFDKNAIFVRDYSYNHEEEMIYEITFFGRNAICFAKDFDNGTVIIKQGENIVKSIPKEVKKWYNTLGRERNEQKNIYYKSYTFNNRSNNKTSC